jgi:hypothetical protein
MGSFFHVQGGGGNFPDTPSPPSNLAVARFLRDRGGLSVESILGAEGLSIKSLMDSFTNLQSCQLWSHDTYLEAATLTKEQAGLIGSGYAGPLVDLNGVKLNANQVPIFHNVV